jgi:hypothetical protein
MKQLATTGNVVQVSVVQDDCTMVSPAEFTRALQIIQSPARKSKVMMAAKKRWNKRANQGVSPMSTKKETAERAVGRKFPTQFGGVSMSHRKETIEMELLREQVRNMRVTNARLEVELRAVVDDKCFAAERRKFDLAILREQVRSLKITNDLQEKELRNKKG